MQDVAHSKEHLQKMRNFFDSGITRDYHFRKQQLISLRDAIKLHESNLFAALNKDLKKSPEESYATETGLVMSEISFALKHLKRWMRPERVKTNLLNFPSSSHLYHDPYGMVLIIGSWNYPFQLVMNPLVGAIAAGNCAILKPSEYAPATSSAIAQMIQETFDPGYISVYQGEGRTTVNALMDNARFDYIFYTGSAGTGRAVYQAAAKDLIPVTLELGGKSPVIVEPDADIKAAAKRIALGKFLNAGQTCVAPDYVLVHHDVSETLLEELRKTTKKFFGKDASQSYDYGRVVNVKQFDTILSYLPSQQKIAYGGSYNRDELFFEPTILKDITLTDTVMQDEIFGPLLPVISYLQKEDALQTIRSYEKPLSFYLFTRSSKNKAWWIKNVPFGNGCINNTLWHLSNPNLPFGGVGGSGLGAYHGKYSFRTFSHSKGVMATPTWFDPKIKYPPFKGKLRLLKYLIK